MIIYSYNPTMLIKKSQLYECLQKNGQVHIFGFLSWGSLLNLSLCSKKYYLLISNMLIIEKMQKMKKTKTSSKQHMETLKPKNLKQKKIVYSNKEVLEVEIHKLTLGKCREKISDGNWHRITEIPFNNQYLQAKLSTNIVFFFKNSLTNQIFFINRSLIDPNLNFNQPDFSSDDSNPSSIYTELFQGELNELDFISTQTLKARQKQMLEKIEFKKQQIAKKAIDYDQQLIKGVTAKKLAIILCFGGQFSFAVFQDSKCLLHKSDKKYVCRKKAGNRQLTRDKASGSNIQSIGSQIRRDQQKKHMANVSQILNENRQIIESCEVVFLQAPGINRIIVVNESQTLSGVGDKVRSVCLTAKKANYTEVETIMNEICKVSFVSLKEEGGGRTK